MRNLLITLGAAAVLWGVLALALGSASLRLGEGSRRPSPACLPGARERTAALPGTGVSVSPAPEALTANPRSQISFLGVRGSQIGAVDVRGERSGRHRGRLLHYSQGDGASFVPDAPFQAGERVAVSARIGTVATARRVAFGFRVDTPYSTAGTRLFPNPPAAPADYQSFYTQPGLQAPLLTVSVPARDPAAGGILPAHRTGPGQDRPPVYT